MKLLIINGSPRANKSNTKIVIQNWMFERSVQKDFINATDIYNGKIDLSILYGYDAYLVAFPLYVDSIPGILKWLFEQMENEKQRFVGAKIYFIVHSGFPEACHSRGVEKYLEMFSTIMNMKYMNTVVLGGSEGIKPAPRIFFKKKIKVFKLLKENILESKVFDKKLISKLIACERLPFIMKIFYKLNPSSFYWNSLLKKNHVFENRYDQPMMD